MFEKLIEAYPELGSQENAKLFYNGTILLFDDGDGIPYIKEWNYSKPIPDGLKLGK